MNRGASWEERKAEALRQHRSGDLPGAAQAYDQLLIERQDAAELLELRGIVHGQSGQPDLAASFIRRAITLDATVARFHANLGSTLQQLGRAEEAAASFGQALALDSDSLPAIEAYGRALLDIGCVEAALPLLEQAASRDPANAAAQTNLGVALLALGRSAEAVVACERAVSRAENFGDGWYNLACARAAASKSAAEREQALAAFDRALALDPDNADAHHGRGDALRATGHYPEAVTAYRDALALRDDFGPALLNLGNLLIELGQLDEAITTLRRAVAAAPDNPSVWTAFADLHRFSANDPEFAQLRALAGKPADDGSMQAAACFAMSKACEDIGDLAGAFNWLKFGNRLKRATFRYDVSADERQMAELCRVASPEFLRRFAEWGVDSARPIFIVGMPRSGSTLVEQILASHPAVYGAGELPDFQQAVRRELPDYPRGLPALSAARIRAIADSYLMALGRIDGVAPYVTDKLLANFLYIGVIHACFPRARIIHCTRDALDTTFSCYRKLFVGAQHFAYDLEELGRYHRAYRQLMAHWQQVLPGRIYAASYEALIADPERQVRQLLEHCGLPWADACLNFHRNPRPVFTASAAEVRKDFYTYSIGRARPYRAHLRELIEALEDQGRL